MLAILLEVLDMNHTLLKSVIYDQHEFIRNFQIVPRNYCLLYTSDAADD